MDELVKRSDVLSAYYDDFYSHDYFPFEDVLNSVPAVDAVPIDELLELRDKLYSTDRITMNGLKMLNELIAMHDGGRKEGAD